MRARPSSAQTRTGMPASDGAPAARPSARRPPASGAGGGELGGSSSSSARVIRTTNAFGTSCTSRHGSPQTETATRVACGVRA